MVDLLWDAGVPVAAAAATAHEPGSAGTQTPESDWSGVTGEHGATSRAIESRRR